MTDPMDVIDATNKALDIILISLALLQTITGKSKEEVLQAIIEENGKTDELLKKLR